MTLSKLSIFANLALAASAILLPPTVTADELGDDLTIEGVLFDPFKRSVALECPGCALAIQEEQSISWEENAGSTFLLDFEIGGRKDTLNTNDGYQLFPPNLNAGIPSFHVTQTDPNSDKEPLRLLVTGYTFRYNGAETVSEAGMELLAMSLQISSLNGVAVAPPVLQVNVLKDTTGRLMIHSFETTRTLRASPLVQNEDCNEWPLLCKWKSIVAERIEKMKKMGKGCHKRPHGQHNPMMEDTIQGKPPHRFRPGHPHHRPQHAGPGPHSQHRMHLFARRAFFTVFIPIIVGIFAGTVTYLVGMVLGTLIAIIIAKVRGQDYQRIALEEDVEVGDAKVQSEKEEPAELPAYDAPPVYEEPAEKEADESK